MNIKEAIENLIEGEKIKLPEWTGYWFVQKGVYVDKDNPELSISVLTKKGDILSTPWIEKYKHRDDFEITDGSLGFDFAILALQNNKRVSRKGWNGKDQWVILIHPGNAMFTKARVGSYPMKTCLGLKNAQWDMQPGWVPSQGDLLATDWVALVD